VGCILGQHLTESNTYSQAEGDRAEIRMGGSIRGAWL